MKSDLSLVDLFAGAGGLSAGLGLAGFKSLYANEFIPQFAATYKRNHPDALVDTRDIRAVDADLVRRDLGLQPGDLDLLAGGPPCQGFSINAPIRSLDDRRNHLFRDYLRFVDAFRPKAVLIENVPGLVSFEGGSTLDAILQSLNELGYAADVRILYAPHYGVPQTRWRTIVLATPDLDRDVSHLFPVPEHHAPSRINFTTQHRDRNLIASSALELPSHVTVEDAISDLPPLVNGGSSPTGSPYTSGPRTEYQATMRTGSVGVTNHRTMALATINTERLRHIPEGGNWTDIPEHLLPAGMRRARRSDHTKRYGRARRDGLSSTILTKCDPHWGAYFHYEQDRVFSVREAARIQSFPDTYEFFGSLSDQYAQVGNAVPPLLGRALGVGLAENARQYDSRELRSA